MTEVLEAEVVRERTLSYRVQGLEPGPQISGKQGSQEVPGGDTDKRY